MPDPVPPLLAPLFTGASRRRLVAVALLWAAAALWFWVWWLTPGHVGAGAGGAVRFGLASVLMAWLTFLQGYFLYFALRAVRSVSPDPVPGQYRVAMVVTKAPSEPFALVARTLEAMLAQDPPHDTWLADEDPTPETRAWCAARGVRISTRHGRADYHRADWPRRTRCKEGNLAFFYDHWGYDGYDIVAQMDADHVPQPGYLREMLRPFADARVGYVSAPSICASNAGPFWAVRTRLHTEGPFHGIIQAGYSNGFAPMCIGSHYAVRTKALRQVGGLGPELAEDHSTTMMLNAGGWRGVHAIDAIAVGDGPATVADMATQEFQWSRSLMTLWLQHSGRYLPHLPRHLRAQFAFCQLFYPLFALTHVAMYLLPIAALAFDVTYARVTYGAYLAHAAPPVLLLLVFAAMLRRAGHFRPADAPVLSWEKLLFVLLQWPWVAWGCVMALRDRITGRFVDFRITPKGDVGRDRLPWRVVAVGAVLALGCLLPPLALGGATEAAGFYLLALLAGAFYAAAVAVTVIRHAREAGPRLCLRARSPWRLSGWHLEGALQGTVAAGLVVLLALALAARTGPAVLALQTGLEPLRLVEPAYRVAGAGSAAAGPIAYRLAPSWGGP